MFNENTLREEIAKTWGEYGAHMLVFDSLLKSKLTEKDLRLAFQAGAERGWFVGAGNYFDPPLDEDEYIRSLTASEEEEKVPVTYRTLINSVRDWEEFCDITGTSLYAKKEGYVFSNSEVFHIDKDAAERLGI